MSENIDEVGARALSVYESAKALEVRSREDFARGGELIAALTGAEKEIGYTFDPIVDSASAALKTAKAQRDKYLVPVVDEKKRIKTVMARWVEEEKAAERKRERDAEDLRLAEAAAMASVGDNAAAQEIIDAPAPVVTPQRFVTEDVSTRTTWSAKVFSLHEMIVAAYRKQIPEEYLLPNQVLLNSLARANKDKMDIPGVKAVAATGIVG